MSGIASGVQSLNSDDRQPCAQCKAPMVEVVRIAPVLHEPGLIAYECPQCGHVCSIIQAPAHSTTNKH